jgi:hypothetical protein
MHQWLGRTLTITILLAGMCATGTRVAADEVLDWNAVALRALQRGSVPGAIQSRAMASVHTAMFDALNGIERRFTPIHVTAVAPPGASRRAAIVQAAYTTLVGLFPDQLADFQAAVEASFAGIAADAANEHSVSIARGVAWGTEVGDEVVSWRNHDGLNPPGAPFTGNMALGQWRPTPPGFLPMLVPTMGSMTPFVIDTVSRFPLAGPPSLTSPEYAADVNEVQAVGSVGSTARTADQTESARFWAGTATGFWNRAAQTASRQRHLTLSENARLFALLNIAQADALIVTWHAKLSDNFWRPITAIRLASTDGNPDTTEDPTWTPLLFTPPYPEYCSGHQSVDGTSQYVLTAYFGEQPVEGTSEGYRPGGVDVVRSFASFKAAADEALLARVWSGIHFRFTMLDTRAMAEQVAAYVLQTAAQPANGARTGQIRQ